MASARKSSTPDSLGDLGRRQPVVAGDHDGADAHRAQLVEALAHAVLDDVLEVDDAEHLARRGDRQRGAALAADPVELALELGGRLPPCSDDQRDDRVARALAQARGRPGPRRSCGSRR